MERGIDRAIEERVGLPRLPAHLEWRTVNGRPKIKPKARRQERRRSNPVGPGPLKRAG